MPFNNPTVAEFKDYWYRDFPYGTDPDTSVLDKDITKAFGQTNVNINQNLFSNQEDYTIGYMLLAAHYLVIDLQMASQGVSGGGFSWLTTSKSVGSVSEGFQIPQRILDDPNMAMLSQTLYGAQYLQLLLPRLTGNMFNVYGSTRP
jgi:hypothetical protein